MMKKLKVLFCFFVTLLGGNYFASAPVSPLDFSASHDSCLFPKDCFCDDCFESLFVENSDNAEGFERGEICLSPSPFSFDDESNQLEASSASPVLALSENDRKGQVKFTLLKAYKAEYGKIRVSQKFSSEKYPKLGRWVDRQRQAYRNMKLLEKKIVPKSSNRISDEKIAKLEAMGFEWSVCISRKKRKHEATQSELGKKSR